MRNIMSLIIMVMVAQLGLAQADMDRFEVQVDGLGCPFCAYGLEKKFKELKGIKNVAIDIETGDFSFAYPADQGLTLERVEKQVELAGYTPMSSKVVRASGEVEGGDASNPQSAEGKLISKEFQVAGNCAMCKARIQKAALDITGVAEAAWDVETKVFDVAFNPEVTGLSEIEKAIAEIGHDTPNFRASEAVYNSLPACCHYERLDQ